RQAVENPVDVFRKPLAACIERRSIERGVAVDAAGIAVAFQDGAEGCGHRDPALGVDLVDVCRDKAVHPVARASPDAGHHARLGRTELAQSNVSRLRLPPKGRGTTWTGHIWDRMGLYGCQWNEALLCRVCGVGLWIVAGQPLDGLVRRPSAAIVSENCSRPAARLRPKTLGAG